MPFLLSGSDRTVLGRRWIRIRRGANGSDFDNDRYLRSVAPSIGIGLAHRLDLAPHVLCGNGGRAGGRRVYVGQGRSAARGSDIDWDTGTADVEGRGCLLVSKLGDTATNIGGQQGAQGAN